MNQRRGSGESTGEWSVRFEDIAFPAGEPDTEPDSQTRDELGDLEIERRSAEVRHLEIQGEALRQDIEQRETYARRVFVLLCCWLAALLGVLLLVGFEERTGFHLSGGVLIALISGTTASVVGVFVVGMRYLFPRRSVNRYVRALALPES